MKVHVQAFATSLPKFIRVFELVRTNKLYQTFVCKLGAAQVCEVKMASVYGTLPSYRQIAQLEKKSLKVNKSTSFPLFESENELISFYLHLEIIFLVIRINV